MSRFAKIDFSVLDQYPNIRFYMRNTAYAGKDLPEGLRRMVQTMSCDSIEAFRAMEYKERTALLNVLEEDQITFYVSLKNKFGAELAAHQQKQTYTPVKAPTQKPSRKAAAQGNDAPRRRPDAPAGGSRIGNDFLKGVPGATAPGTSRTPPAQAAGPAAFTPEPSGAGCIDHGGRTMLADHCVLQRAVAQRNLDHRTTGLIHCLLHGDRHFLHCLCPCRCRRRRHPPR